MTTKKFIAFMYKLAKPKQNYLYSYCVSYHVQADISYFCL